MPTDRSLAAEAETMEIIDQHASIVETTAMDHNREGEIRKVLDADRDWLIDFVDIEELGSVTDNDEAWNTVVSELSQQGEEHLSDRLSSLKERAERPFPSLLKLEFEPEDGLEFVPGQYVRISYEDEEPRVYSIASSPNSTDVDLCIRRVPGGHLTPTLCDETVVGDDLFVRGPFGDEFTLTPPSDRDVIFIATGTGVAPFKSMIDYIFEENRDEYNGEKRDIWLFLGSSWKDHLPYREEFSEYTAEWENFHYVPTCSREEYLSEWAGETAYVQQTFLKYLDEQETAADSLPAEIAGWVRETPVYDINARIDPSSMEVYVCGIGAMANSVSDVVEQFNLPDNHYKKESYG
ncbi:FAD-binding oxidoreductase [Haladaptatus halobius]|uniref:FAD-binding oxidoreductase n=1 Tax=Haladaptatus halobius TaxID=2884875 RepID=UPI001D0B5F62|nr:FAD-binding oxidoreductase [Haladaptatus halobius]